MNIIIFTTAGNTFSFDNCSNIRVTSDGLKFKYLGNTTNVYRNAEFKWVGTAGYAINDVSVTSELKTRS